eukprot:s444_g51.t1
MPRPKKRSVAADGLSHQDLLETEAMKMQALREVQEKLKQEMARRRDAAVSGGSKDSYKTADGNGPSQRMSTLDTPSYVSPMAQHPGVQPASMMMGAGTPAVQPQPQGVQHGNPMMMSGTPGIPQPMVASGEALSESLRTLELPKLTECTAVEFGDWLAAITPLMSDLNSTSATWWSLTMAAAQRYYELWRVASPLDRLRLKVETDPDAKKFPRTEQRAVTMRLAAVPEQVRRNVIASRKMSSVEIVFTLLCKYQPGGAQERTVLLRDLSENRLFANANVKDLLITLRTWRRNFGRASELGVQLPDPLLLVSLLTKWSDLLSRLGGSQMAFRIAGMRQMLSLDTTPVPSSVVEFAEHLQAKAEQLMLATPTSTSTLSTTTSPSGSATTVVKPKELPSR